MINDDFFRRSHVYAVDEAFFRRNNLPSVFGDFDTMLRTALTNKGTPYDYTDGFLDGELRGFSNGAETSIKSFVTGGKTKIFVTEDQIIPFSKNPDLFENPEIKPLLKDFTNNLPENKPQYLTDVENDLLTVKQKYKYLKNNVWNQPLEIEKNYEGFLNKPFQIQKEYDDYLNTFNTFDKTVPLETQLNDLLNQKESELVAETKKKLVQKTLKNLTKREEEEKVYNGPINEEYLKKINVELSRLNNLKKSNKQHYEPKINEIKELNKKLYEYMNFKEKPDIFKLALQKEKQDFELEKNAYIKDIKEEKELLELTKRSYKDDINNLKNKLEETKTYFYERPDNLWQADFVKIKNRGNAILKTNTFSTYNIPNIQKLIPIAETNIHDRTRIINETKLTDENLEHIKNYTGKKIVSRNLFDYIDVPHQGVIYTLEESLNQKYPNMNPGDKIAMTKYIEDKKKVNNKKNKK